MKKIFILGVILLLAVNVHGQVPASFKYQAVLRDARGNIRANTSTNIIIDILQGSATGSVVYSETHIVTTDGYGLINLNLGNGTATVGTLSGINWNTGIYYVKITVDGSVMGTSQLLSVPYALYSAKAGNGFSGDYNDLINRPTLGTGTVTSVTGTSPVNVLTGTTTPVISMAQASATTNGYLSSTDWTSFNNKSSFTGTWSDITGKPAFATVATTGSYNDLINKPTFSAAWSDITGKPTFAAVATSGNFDDLINKPILSNGTVTNVTGTAPVNVVAGTTTPVISMAQANSTTNGYLSSTDWTIFNSKSTFSGAWADLTGKPAFATVATTGNYNHLINLPAIDGSETKVIAGDNIIVTGTGKESDNYVISSKTFKIGDSYGGGIIFYVDPTGQHGLIAATDDIEFIEGDGSSSSFTWENGYMYNITGASGDGLNAGTMNTTLIVMSQIGNEASGIFAAKLCVDYTAMVDEITYGGWYLPSIYELGLLYMQKDVVGGFNENYYWSSTEGERDFTNGIYRAWFQDFLGGGNQDMASTSEYFGVRAIRAF